MDRRSFIKNTSALVAVPAIIGGQVIKVWGARENFVPVVPEGKILVLIQLDGGNDGLNMVIPEDQYSVLAQLRPEVVIPQDKILTLNGKTGLHPSFSEIWQLYMQQKIMVIQNVGYPAPNLSHFRSKEIFLSASGSGQVITSGWFGRYLSMVHPDYPANYPSQDTPHPLAITIGNMSSPLCQGNITDMSIAVQNLTSGYQSQQGDTEYPDTPYGHELKYISGAMEKTGRYLQEVLQAGDSAQNLSTYYPSSGNTLSDQLKIVAKLISGGLKTPVYVVSLGGFDTHANQVVSSAHETGTHANQLKKISTAVYAFLDDLNLHQMGDKVIGIIYSEFGRRIKSNKSDGTDHGEAYPMVLFGNLINPVIHGENPQLSLSMTVRDSVPWKVDFRSIYRSVLTDWFEANPADVAKVLFGDFEHIQILKKPVNVKKLTGKTENQTVEVYPNPVADKAMVKFNFPGGKIMIKAVSLSGQEIPLFHSNYLQKGYQSISISKNGITPGTYVLVVTHDSGIFTRKILIK